MLKFVLFPVLTFLTRFLDKFSADEQTNEPKGALWQTTIILTSEAKLSGSGITTIMEFSREKLQEAIKLAKQ